MTASRFPGKVLAPLAGRPVIKHLLDACDRAGLRKYVAVCIPHGTAEDPLSAYLSRAAVRAIHAAPDIDPDNVLSRLFYATSVIGSSPADTIVRLTADCPLIDHRVLLSQVGNFDRRSQYSGVVNSPDGTDVEVMSWDALRDTHRNAKDKADREHVTPHLQRRVGFVPPKPDAKLRFSVDTVEDLRRCERLIDRVGVGAEWQQYVAALKSGA